MTEPRSDFPSRNLSRLDAGLGEQHEFDLVLPGWDAASRWRFGTGSVAEASLCRDAGCADPLVVSAGSGGERAVNTLALTVSERLDLEPETVLAGMGMALPHPVLRSPDEVAAALQTHDRDNEYGQGERTALRWVLGEGRVRPVSWRPWPGGAPDPWQVAAERTMAGARPVPDDERDRLNGITAQLRWAVRTVGPMALWSGEWSRWLGRRLTGRTEVPAFPDADDLCTLGRGRRFRTWQVVDGHGVLGAVCPEGRRHRWVATIDGERLSELVHGTVIDAAYEIAVRAYGQGWARPDVTADES